MLVSVSPVGPAATTRPSASITTEWQRLAAKFRSCVATTIVSAALAIEPAEQGGDVELVAEIERRRRLVEQQDVRLLGQRAGDDDALLLAAGERGETAALEGERCPVAASASRAIGHVARALEFEGAEVGVAPHQGDLEHGVVEREVRFLRHDRDATARARRAASDATVAAVERDGPGVGPQHAGEQAEQRRLARAVRAENAHDAARARRER